MTTARETGCYIVRQTNLWKRGTIFFVIKVLQKKNQRSYFFHRQARWIFRTIICRPSYFSLSPFDALMYDGNLFRAPFVLRSSTLVPPITVALPKHTPELLFYPVSRLRYLVFTGCMLFYYLSLSPLVFIYRHQKSVELSFEYKTTSSCRHVN